MKTLLNQKKFQSYYTENKYISKFMSLELDLSDNDILLEPAAGEGALIDAALDVNHNIRVQAFDIDPLAIQTLSEKYGMNERITITYADTLTTNKFAFKSFDKIIANPPWGADLSAVKNKLSNLYSQYSALESYSLFLVRALKMLKPGGKLVFIIPDTYLFVHKQEKLRRYILENFMINKIVRFPSKFFTGINFGYSGLTIISISANSPVFNHRLRVYNNLGSVDELLTLSDKNIEFEVPQHELLEIDNSPLVLDTFLENSFSKKDFYLGDIADVVTGIYTGDNIRYLKAASKLVKNSKNYEIVSPSELYTESSFTLDGVDSDEAVYIPIVKGSTRVKYTVPPDNWYIDWSLSAIRHYSQKKGKARFQNTKYYFKKGIGLPMLKSSKMSAFILENRVFDQSIVGIFPKNPLWFKFLLGFLNSDVAKKLINAINPSVNNSANYIKRLPIIRPSDETLEIINNLVDNLSTNINVQESENKLNEILNKIYGNQ